MSNFYFTCQKLSCQFFTKSASLLDELHKRGCAVTLNLHPAEGIWPHEMQYQEMAKRMNVSPPNPVEFVGSDPKFMNNYFDVVLHPFEDMGVDFWWIDWQQKNKEEVDPLITLNHAHHHDNLRTNKRPMILSRWCGLGGQRYPVGFSGDTTVEWASLQFQLYFTSTAANVGFNFWSHDIGGHHGGHETAELYLRWVQLGCLLPIMRMHSNTNMFHERLPWNYDKTTEIFAKEAMKFHVRMTPLFYSLSFDDLIIRPMYHYEHEEEAAYFCPSQYFIGKDIIAAPFITPLDPDLGQAFEAVWLPGDFFDYFTGRIYNSGWHMIYGDLSTIPLFVRAGGIFVTEEKEKLIVECFPMDSKTFTVVDDDGGKVYNSDKHLTKISTFSTIDKDSNSMKSLEVKFESEGNTKYIKNRKYVIKIRNYMSDKVTFTNCKADSIRKEKNDLVIELKSQKFPFSIKTESDFIVYDKPSKDDVFQFIKRTNMNMWTKKDYFELLEKNNLKPLHDFLSVDAKIRMHIAFYLLDCGFYEYPYDSVLTQLSFSQTVQTTSITH